MAIDEFKATDLMARLDAILVAGIASPKEGRMLMRQMPESDINEAFHAELPGYITGFRHFLEHQPVDQNIKITPAARAAILDVALEKITRGEVINLLTRKNVQEENDLFWLMKTQDSAALFIPLINHMGAAHFMSAVRTIEANFPDDTDYTVLKACHNLKNLITRMDTPKMSADVTDVFESYQAWKLLVVPAPVQPKATTKGTGCIFAGVALVKWGSGQISAAVRRTAAARAVKKSMISSPAPDGQQVLPFDASSSGERAEL